MRVVGIKVLKNKLSEYVRLAAQGETVLITDRDRVVAELVRQGVVTPALVAPGSRPIVPARTAKLADVLAELDSDRGDRFARLHGPYLSV